MDLIAVQALLPIYCQIILVPLSPIALFLGPDHRLANKCRVAVGVRAPFLFLKYLHYVSNHVTASEEESTRVIDTFSE
jgi:hypothetical protein